MAVDTTALEEHLASLNPPVTGWYTWRPNQFYTKDPSDPTRYISTDVMADGTINEILDSAQDEADRQIELIEQAGNTKISEINEQNYSYIQVKAICLQTFRSLRSFFNQQGIGSAVAIVESGIRQLNNLP